MRVIRFVALLALLLVLVGVAGAASVAQGERLDEKCPAFDLTGRPVVRVVTVLGETRCIYRRTAEAEECPNNTPQGWTVVGLVNPPKNKDKVVCVYHDLGRAD